MGNKKSNNGYTVEDADKYAPKGWGQKAAGDADGPYEYTLSSGDVILIKKLTMPEILRLGFLDKLDFFTKALSENADPAKALANAPQDADFAKKLLSNWSEMEDVIDKLLIAGVVAPQVVENVPNPVRKTGVVYCDTIPFNDKVDLFGELMDTDDLTRFRDEPETGVGHVSDGESVSDTTEQPVGV